MSQITHHSSVLATHLLSTRSAGEVEYKLTLLLGFCRLLLTGVTFMLSKLRDLLYSFFKIEDVPWVTIAVFDELFFEYCRFF